MASPAMFRGGWRESPAGWLSVPLTMLPVLWLRSGDRSAVISECRDLHTEVTSQPVPETALTPIYGHFVLIQTGLLRLTNQGGGRGLWSAQVLLSH